MAQLPDGMPVLMSRLPVNKAGYPVPWFVDCSTGEPDFRVIRRGGIDIAVQRNLCWVCGHLLDPLASFVSGPMCGVNRTNAEPPSHPACATWSARACPFLANPGMARRERGMPEHRNIAGKPILRNPGVALVWTVRVRDTFRFSDGAGGYLFHMGPPRRVEWFAHGRPATREEIVASIDGGLPILYDMAAKQDAEEGGTGCTDAVTEQVGVLMELVPA